MTEPLHPHPRCPYARWARDGGHGPQEPCICHVRLPSGIDWDSLPTLRIDNRVVIETAGGPIAVVPEQLPVLAEVACPTCSTTIRARMADAEHPAPIGYAAVNVAGGAAIFPTPEQAALVLGDDPTGWRVVALVPVT